MKVTLLGTSAAEGWPGLFCRCEACGKARTLRGKNIRTRASALIDGSLKIDFPPDMLHQVIEFDLDLREINALLFTHAHDDHCATAELQYMNEFFVTTEFDKPLPVYGPADVTTRLEQGLDLSRLPLTLHTLEPWRTVSIPDYRITPILAQHDPAQLCFNYIIEGREGATLLYATDTGWYEEATWRFLRRFHLDGIVVECTKGPVEGGYMAHMSIPDVLRMRSKLVKHGSLNPEGPMVTTHHSHLGGMMHDELEARLNPHGVNVGYDGMVFHVDPRPAKAAAPREYASATSAKKPDTLRA